MNIGEQLCELTKKIWRYYLLEPSAESFSEMFGIVADDMVIIGTGKHELYIGKQQILKELSANLQVAVNISFDVFDEWYGYVEITPEAYMVYGGLWARQKDNAENPIALIEMDTRFTFIYKKTDDIWELKHMHQSVPYMDQMEGEFYPKTMTQRAEEAMKLVALFKRKSELDMMTSVYNHESFRILVTEAINSDLKIGTFLLFDLDKFKDLNDNYGHMTGDSVLKIFAKMLTSHFKDDAIIGRMGGDEFAVFLPYSEEPSIEHLINGLAKAYQAEAEKTSGVEKVCFSVGVVEFSAPFPSFNKMFNTTDNVMYDAKKNGRNTFCFRKY